MEIDKLIRKHAIKNAHDYGKSNFKNVVGKIVGEHPEVKENMKEFIEKAKQICDEVNHMSREDIESELSKYEFASKTEKEREWLVEGIIKGKVVTRYSPEPNGYMHIGHAKTVFINEAISKKYEGKQILKFDDTNPKTCKQEFVDSIIKDCEWLGVGFDKIVHVSDMLDKMRKYCKKLIEEECAYVCTCDADSIKKNRLKGVECACRSRSANENLEIWQKMNEDLEEGKAIVRFKGDMQSNNTVMRDPAIYRIIDSEHYRLGDKYRVWPTYDFENPISDSECGVTHVLRSKEFELRAELHKAILRALKLKEIAYYEYARLDLDGYPVSKRLIRPLVDNGFFTGYDDPRLVTIAGLRRRGIPRDAIKTFTLSFGLSKQEIKTDLKKLIAEARKHYDPIAKRYFAVRNPKKIIVKGMGKGSVSISLHPNKDIGSRNVTFSESIYIDENDLLLLKPRTIIRLKDLKNIEIIDNGMAKVAEDQSINRDMKKIQWVDANNYAKCAMWIIDRPFIDGKPNDASLREVEIACEKESEKIKEKEVVQFERIGFCILDDKKKGRYIKID